MDHVTDEAAEAAGRARFGEGDNHDADIMAAVQFIAASDNPSALLRDITDGDLIPASFMQALATYGEQLRAGDPPIVQHS